MSPYIVGLTGGIGSGKTTVCRLLSDRGAMIIDADAIVHELQRPGTDVFKEIVEAFGEDVVGPDGGLDRGKMAAIVFNDPEQRKKLESITWPRVGERVAELMQQADEDAVVVIDVPLMAESRGAGRQYDTIVVVDASNDTQIRHLADKGVSRSDAEARMGAQASREERMKLADHVVTNDDSLDDLEKQVDALWLELQQGAKAKT
jgi:dephospho-CoA kinase